MHHDLDLHAVEQMFMPVSAPPATYVDVLIDDVYYQDHRSRSSTRTGCDARRRAVVPPCAAPPRRIVRKRA